MAEKTTKKRKTRKKASASKTRMSRAQMDNLLVENFVAMQRVLTNLSIKFDNLADQTSKLLGLFEISAKSFAENQGSGISGEDKEFLAKLDELMEQNKLIARGLTMMSAHSPPPAHRQQPMNQMQQAPMNPVPNPLPPQKRLGSPSITERHPISGRWINTTTFFS